MHARHRHRQTDVQFSEEDVRLLLSGIRGDKAGGADELSPRLLLDLRDYVATPLYLLFRKGLDTGMVQTGNVQILLQFSRRAIGASKKTIGQLV